MVTNLKVSLLPCERVFYRPKHSGRGEMQKWNMPTDRAQWIHEKNGVICLVFIITSRVMVIIMSRLAHFFVLYASDSKKWVTVWANYI